jgi:hypothetical protein
MSGTGLGSKDTETKESSKILQFYKKTKKANELF